MTSPSKKTIIFISYAHDDMEDLESFCEYAAILRGNGAEVIMDALQGTAPAEGWAAWADNAMARADYILTFMTPAYAEQYSRALAPGEWPGPVLRPERHAEIFSVEKIAYAGWETDLEDLTGAAILKDFPISEIQAGEFDKAFVRRITGHANPVAVPADEELCKETHALYELGAQDWAQIVAFLGQCDQRIESMPEVVGDLLAAAAACYIDEDSGDSLVAIAAIERAIGLMGTPEGNLRTYCHALRYQACAWNERGEHADAVKSYCRAAEVFAEHAFAPENAPDWDEVVLASRDYDTAGTILIEDLNLPEDAIPRYQQALELLERGGLVAPWRRVYPLQCLAHAYLATGNTQSADLCIAECEVLAERWLASAPRQLARSIYSLSISLSCAGQYDRAEYFAALALSFIEQFEGPFSEELCDYLDQLAYLKTSLGAVHEAVALCERVCKICAQAHGVGHLEHIEALCNLADAVVETEDLERAEALLLDARAAAESGNAPPINIARVLRSLGHAYIDEERFDEAETAIRDALAIHQEIDGEDSLGYVFALEDLAQVLDLRGNHDEAAHLLRQSLTTVKKAAGAGSHDHATTLHCLGMVLNHAERHGEAVPVLEEAVAILQRVTGGKHVHLLRSLEVLEDAYLGNREFEKAAGISEELETLAELLGEDE